MGLDFWSHIGKSLSRVGAGAVAGGISGGTVGALGGTAALPVVGTLAGAGGLGLLGGIAGGLGGLFDAAQNWGADDQQATAQDASTQAAQTAATQTTNLDDAYKQQAAAIQAQANPYTDPGNLQRLIAQRQNAVAQSFNGAPRALDAQLAARGMLGSGAEVAGLGALDAGHAQAMSQADIGTQNEMLDKGTAFEQQRNQNEMSALAGQGGMINQLGQQASYNQDVANQAYGRAQQQDEGLGQAIGSIGQTAMMLPMFQKYAQAPVTPATPIAPGAQSQFTIPQNLSLPPGLAMGPQPQQATYQPPQEAYRMQPMNAASAHGGILNQARWMLGGLQGNGAPRMPKQQQTSLGYTPINNGGY